MTLCAKALPSPHPFKNLIWHTRPSKSKSRRGPGDEANNVTEYGSASKNTDSSVFYTEIEIKILNTDSDPKNTDRDPIIRVIAIQQITVTLR